MAKVNKILPTGGIDKENDLARVGEGDYVGALDISHETTNGNTTNAIQPEKGNVYAYNTLNATVQNKAWRFFFDYAQPGVGYFIKIYLITPSGISVQINTVPSPPVNYADAVVKLTAMWAAVFSAPTFTHPTLGNINTIFLNSNTLSFQQLTATSGYMFVYPVTVAVGMDYNFDIANIHGTRLGTATIIQEARSADIAKPMVECGSKEIDGDKFCLWTNGYQMPTEIGGGILSITNIGTSIRVNFNSATNIATLGFTTIKISGSNSGSYANGTWPCTAIGANSLLLNGSTFIANGGAGGVGTVWSESLGEVGVAQKDLNTDSWTYTLLLRTKEIPLRVKKQPSFPAGERNNTKVSLYWTDDNIEPKVFYYEGAYISNGAITSVNPLGQYQYGTIGLETNLILTNLGVRLSFLGQLPSGGAVSSGDWIYGVRFTTASYQPTEIIPLSNPINVYNASPSNPKAIVGDAEGTVTTKINQFKVDGIIPDLYPYIELIGINYVGNNQLIQKISRYPLAAGQTEIYINHVGNESDTTTLTIGELLFLNADYFLAKSIAVMQNRLILSNLQGYDEIDLTPWTSQLQHKIIRDNIKAVNSAVGSTGGINPYDFGEYQDPLNVFNLLGYTVNEVQRMYVRVRWKKSKRLSNGYWWDDLVINDMTQNRKIPPLQTGSSDFITLPDRRAGATFSGLQLTTAGKTYYGVYTYGINCPDLDLDFIVDGQRIRDLIDEIYIYRADTVPEVLASGVLSMGATGAFAMEETTSATGSSVGYGYGVPPAVAVGDFTSQTCGDAGTVPGYIPYPVQHPTVDDFVLSVTEVDQFKYPFDMNNTSDPNNPGAFETDYSFALPLYPYKSEPKIAAFYVPDHILNANDNIGAYGSGDQILNYGSSERFNSQPQILDTVTNVTSYFNNEWAEYNGNGNAYPTVVDLDNSALVPPGGSVTFGGLTFSKQEWEFFTYGSPGAPGSPAIGRTFLWENELSYVVHSNTAFTNPSSNPWYGVNMAQYYRSKNYDPTNPDTNKYGNRATTEIRWTGAYLRVSEALIGQPNPINVYGGDTFTQKTYIRTRRPTTPTLIPPNPSPPITTQRTEGGGGGIGIYSQNKGNIQMRRKDLPTSQNLFPDLTDIVWLTDVLPNQNFYNRGYAPNTAIDTTTGYDVTVNLGKDFPVRIAYSEIKVQNGLQDGYRTLLPLNYKDLDLIWGEIIDHESLNGELITLQPSYFQRQFFNNTGVLQALGNGQINIGDGELLARTGNTLSRFGTKNKFGIAIGLSQGGNQVLYFWDATQKSIMRFGQDGIKDLCLLANFKGWIEQNCTWVFDKDNPLGGEGIVAVWNQQKREVIWTVRGKRESPLWSNSTNYVIGNYVHINPQVFSTFSQTGEIYVATQPSVHIQPEVTAGWQNYWLKVPHTDPNYWNEYTIVFNELRNRFTKYATPIVRYYAPFRNTYLSGLPPWGNGLFPTSNDVSRMYEHNRGKRLQWYDDRLISEGYIDLLFNKDDMWIKQYQALMFNSKVIPWKLQIFTKDHETYALPPDFEAFLTLWNVKIKCDILTAPNGTNEEDTSLLNGQYVIVRFYFKPDEEQVLVETSLKYIGLYQVYNQ